MWIVTAAWGIIIPIAGWFLSNLSKDVKSILLNQEKVTANVIEIRTDLFHLRALATDNSKRLSHVETTIARIEEWKKQF